MNIWPTLRVVALGMLFGVVFTCVAVLMLLHQEMTSAPPSYNSASTHPKPRSVP